MTKKYTKKDFIKKAKEDSGYNLVIVWSCEIDNH